MVRAALTCLFLAIWAGAAPAQQTDTETGAGFTTLKGHGGPIMGIAVSSSGQVATASFDNSVGLWTGRVPQWLEGHDAAVTCLAFGDPQTLLTGSDDFSVRLWTGPDTAPRVIGRHKGKITEVALSPDGRTVASASWDGTVALWPLDGGAATVLDDHDGGVNDIVFSPDGSELFVATVNGTISAYKIGQTYEMRPLVDHGFGVNEIVLGEGWLAYGAVDGVTRVINPETAAPIADFSLERRPILAMAHHPDTGQLAVGDGHGFIMVIDVNDWKITKDFRAAHNGPVWALAYSADGEVIHAGGLDDVAYGWPVALLDDFDPAMTTQRSFLREAGTMPNGERQFMRKCSICHALTPPPSRKAGPSLHGVFGRRAGTLPGYLYSPILQGSDIVWSEDTIDALFDLGPDHYIPGSKMPMQRITAQSDRDDLIEFLKSATKTRE